MTAAHSLAGRKGAHASWARTVDRTARTSAARNASPTSIDWHLARLPEQFAGATDEQRQAAAEAARKAYMAELALRSARARQKGRVA